MNMPTNTAYSRTIFCMHGEMPMQTKLEQDYILHSICLRGQIEGAVIYILLVFGMTMTRIG